MNEAIFCLQLAAALGVLAVAVRMGQQALTGYIALSGVLANLFVIKQISLFGFTVTCSDVFAVGGMLGLNLLQEFYGKSAAKKAVQASFLALVCFALFSQVHLLYAPSAVDTTHEAFHQILSSSPRIVIASIGVYVLVQRFDLFFFSALAKPIPLLGARLTLSLLVSQALDTVLFSLAGLYGLVASLFDIMLISYLIKCAVIASASPVASLYRRFARVDA